MVKTRRPTAPHARPDAIPVVFRAGEHALSIAAEIEGRWTVSVDGGPASQTYRTQVEAWEAGVRLAAELDQPRGP
jgi:hypothetical protein